ncbi:MAG TPA: sensor histidine kinase [Anaerolineales bacterium]
MVTSLHHFFELNATLVYFSYGLVFFVLGLAVALQSRQHSRLEMARGLGWLAAFGIAHGFYEWGFVFIPIQASYLSGPVITIFHVFHEIILALSFGFLFQFGAEMLYKRWRRIVILPLLVMVVWMLWFVIPGPALNSSVEAWRQQASIWARYLIGFPAGLVAAAGLRYQAESQIKPLDMESIYKMLRVAGIALIAYAFFGGLIAPAGNFFPAYFLNEVSLAGWIGIPVPVFRSVTGLVLAVAIIRALEVFDLEVDRMLEQIEIERNLTLERERIGRELHDSTIQSIYTAGLLIESAHQKLGEDNAVTPRLARAMGVLNEAIGGLRAYIDDLRPAATGDSLEEAIKDQVANRRLTSLVAVNLDLNLPQDAPFSPVRIPNVLAILGEALSNATRHAQAGLIKVSANKSGNDFILTVEDDGRGYDESSSNRGFGLRNMRDRARLLGGNLTVKSQAGKGTRVILTAPWEEEE